MLTLIRNEKESIINAKNEMLVLKKESREMGNLKQERKSLQGMTTDTMHGMISSRQNIRMMRDDYDKR